MKSIHTAALLATLMLAAAPHTVLASEIGDALHTYYAAEKSALPATAATGALAAVFGGVLLRRRGFARGFGLPLLLIGGATSMGSLVYLSQIDGRQAYYGDLLQQSPAFYRQMEGAHLASMQDDFQRIIWIDSSVAVAGLGLAVYGAVRNRRFAQGLGIGTLISAAALSALEMHNRDRASEYMDAFRSFTAHTSLQAGRDLKSWSLVFHAEY